MNISSAKKITGMDDKKAAITKPMEDELMNVTGGSNPFDSEDAIVPPPDNTFVLDNKNDLEPLIRILV